MTTRTEQLRAVSLTVLMIMSVVASSAVFAGTAAGATVTVSGDVVGPNASGAANHTIVWDGSSTDDFVETTTDENGNFSASLAGGVEYEVSYVQSAPSRNVDYPKDGIVDVYSGGLVTYESNTSGSTTELPEAHNLTITAETPGGDPVNNASVEISDRVETADDVVTASVEGQTNATGATYLRGSSSPGAEVNGSVAVEIIPPDGSGLATNRTVLDVTGQRHLTVTLSPTARVTGQLLEATGEPAADDTLEADPEDGGAEVETVTNSTGNFSVALTKNVTYDFEYRQDNESTTSDIAYPKDGSVDLYTFGLESVSNDTDTGSRTLPEGHNLTITVRNGSGAAVPDATVDVVHRNESESGAVGEVGEQASTNQSGALVHPDSDGPGFEVTGEIYLKITPPDGTELPTVERTVTVSNDTHLNITLVDRPHLSNATIVDNSGDGIVTDGESVTISVNVADAQNVSADVSAFGAGTVNLSEVQDGLYRAQFTANRENAANDGRYDVTITAVDAEGDQATIQTDSIELDVWAPPENQIVAETEDVQIWERSTLPLRADTDQAQVQIDNAYWRIDLKDVGERSLNKDPIGVFQTGSDVPVSFIDSRSLEDLGHRDNQLDTKLVAARLEPGSSTSLTGVSSTTEVEDLLSGSNVNQNATFQTVGQAPLDGSTGNASFTFTPDKPGNYVLLLASNESGGFVVDDSGDLSVDGQTTLLGVDQVMVQDDTSTVSTQGTYASGDNVTVDANTGSVIQPASGENVTHLVAIYDESTFTNQEFKLSVEKPFENFSNNVTLRHSIETTNGVWVVRNDATLAGLTVSETRREGRFPFNESVDILADNTALDVPTVATSDVVWNSSATIVETTANDSVVVETQPSWPAGEYRLVHMAMTENGTQIASNTRTLTFEEPTQANLSVTNASVGATDAYTNESVPIEVTIENTGDLDGTLNLSLTSDGTVLKTTSVTVNGRTTKTVSLSARFDTPGDKSLAVNGVSAGTVSVSPAVVATDFTLNRSSVTIGDAVAVTATVSNSGPNNDSSTIELLVDGSERANKTTGVIRPNDTGTVVFEQTFETAGTFDVTIRDQAKQLISQSVDVSRNSVQLEVNTTPQDATIRRGESITFNVTRASDGQPVPNATVDVAGQSTTTNSSGRATVTLETAGSYTATVSKPDTDNISYADGSVEITVQAPASINVTDVSPLSTLTYTGNTITIEATVENTGDLQGEKNLTVKYDGSTIATPSVTLNGSETRVLAFETTATTTGEIVASVNGVESPTITVEKAAIVRGFSPASSTVTVGSTLSVDASLKNRGSTERTLNVNLTVEGQQVAKRSGVTLGPGEARTITLSWNTTGTTVGAKNVSVSGLTAQTVTVERQTAQLQIAASPSSVVTNESITFTVTRASDGSAVPNATVAVAGQTFTTDSAGQTTATIAVADSYTARANKSQTATEEFDSDSVAVTVNEPANLTVVDTFLGTSQAYVGDSVTVEASVENTGGVSGQRTINLTNSSGAVLANETVSLSSGGSTTVSLTTAFETTGERTLSVAGLTAGSVTIDDQSVVSDFTLNSTAVTTGGTVLVTATVRNRGGTEDSDGETVTFDLAGETVNKTSSAIPADSTVTVNATRTFDTDGDYDIQVESLSPQTVTVSQSVVELSLTVEGNTTVTTGSQITFNVTRANDSEPADATVDVASQTLQTGSDGLATTTINESGTFTAVASKASEGGTDFDSDSVSVTVEEPGDIVVTDAYRETTQAYTGDTVTIQAALENVGDRQATETFNLTDSSGTVLDSTEVTLNGSETTTQSLSATFDSAGTRTLSVDSVQAGSVEIDPQTVVTGFTVNETSVTVNDSVRVTASVRNRGSTNDTDGYTVNLSVSSSGQTYSNSTGAIEAGTTETVTFTPTLDSVGDVSLSVDTLDPKTVTVSRELVQLDITATPSVAATGEEVTFTVTRSDTDAAVANANITVGSQTLTTNSNGNATTTFSATGTYSAQAERGSTATESFEVTSTSLTVNRPANLRIIDTELTSGSSLYAGQTVRVTVDVFNDGGVSGQKTIYLNNSSGQLNSTSVTVGAGATKTVVLTAQLNETGDTELSANGLSVATVEVDPATSVTDISLSQTALTVDTTLLVEATIENRGGIRDSTTVNFSVDDSTQQTRTVTLDPGNSTTESFEYSFDTNGTRTVAVNALSETVSVALDTAGLDISANRTSLVAGQPVQFTVTSEGTRVNATIAVGDSRLSAVNGTATTTLRTAGNYTARATKAANQTTAFESATSAQLRVTDPLTVTDSIDYGTARASPVETDSRADSATIQRNVTITNDGGRAVKLSSAEVVGANASQFAIVSSLSSEIAAGGSETVTVAFRPTTRGSASATLRFKSNTPQTPTRSVSLSGTGEAPAAQLNVSTLQFGEVAVGESTNKTVQVNNTGNRTLVLAASALAAGFARDTKSLSIDPGQSKTITVTFAPTGPRAYGAPLELTTNDPFRPTATVRATGTGVGGAITVSPNPGSGTDYDFGDVTQGTNATTRVYVASTGTEAINVTPTISGSEFDVESNTSEITLAPGESRYLEVTVSPTSDQPTSTLDLTTAASDVANESLQFSATRLTPTASITPEPSGPDPDIDFGGVAVGGSTTESITIENTGEAPLEIDRDEAIPESAPFALTGSTDTLTVPAGETRTISVAFAPTAPGDTSTDLTLTTNDPANQTVTLNLTGSGEATSLTGDASNIDFGSIGQGGSTTATVTLTNDGTEALTNFRVRSKTGEGAAQYAVVSKPASIDAGDSANVTIRFAPQTAGTHSASVTFAAEGSITGSNRFAVSLTGVATPPDVAVSTTQQAFGYVDTGGEPVTRNVTIENQGPPATTLDVESVTVSGTNADEFTIVSAPDGTTLEGGTDLDVTIEFDPTAQGDRTARLNIETNDPDEATKRVRLTGVGAVPDASVSTQSVGFGEVRTGSTSATKTITITNDGGADMSLEGISVDDQQFSIDNGLDKESLVPGASEQVTVSVTPTATGTQRGNLTINTDGGTRTVTLRTTGVEPELTTGSLDGTFGQVRVGSSTRHTVTVQNTGNATLVLDDPSISGSSDFTVVSGDKEIRLGPGQTTTYAIAFTPSSDTTGITGTLEITTNTPNSITQSLSGDGVAADAGLAPSSVDFGAIGVGDTDQTTLNLSNDGTAGLEVTGVTITGSDAGAFSVSGVTTGTVAPDSTESFTVSTSPSTTGSVSAQLQIETRRQGTLTAVLGATGVEPDVQVQRSSITFNRTRLGDTATETLTIRNDGNEELNVTSLSLAGAQPGQFDIAESSLTVPAQSSRTVTVTFRPTSNVQAANNGVAQTAAVVIQSNDPDETVVRTSLSGTGKTPALQSPGAVQFGATSVGDTSTRNVTITNDVSGSASITLEEVSIAGQASSEYTVSQPSQRTLAPGESTTLTVQLTAETTGNKFASLNVITDDPRQPGRAIFLSNTRTIVDVNFGSVNLNYSSVNSGQQPGVTFRRNVPANASIVAAQPTVSTDSDFGFRFEGSASAFGNTSVRTETIDTLRYVSVTKQNLTSSEFENSSLQFRVSKAALADRDAPPEKVSFYEYTGSSYEQMNATLVREERTSYVYSTTTEHFSLFAIGLTEEADISITDLDLSTSSITLGDTAEVSVTVENQGGASGQIDLTLSGDGTDSKTVSVASGASETVTFDVSPSSTGTYSLAVNGQSVGDLDVNPESTPTPTPTPTPDDDDGGAGQQVPPGQIREVSAQSTEQGARVSTTTLDAGQMATISLPDVSSSKASVERLNVTIGESTSIQLDVTRPQDSPPAGTPAFAEDQAGAVQYFSVNDSRMSGSAVTSATFTFTVEAANLPEDVTPEDVRLYRYHDGEWQELETTSLGDGRYMAESPGFSTFAIGYTQQEQTATPTTTTTAEPTTEPAPTTTTAEPTTTTGTETPPPFAPQIPGFGFGLAIIALLVTSLLLYRRD